MYIHIYAQIYNFAGGPLPQDKFGTGNFISFDDF